MHVGVPYQETLRMTCYDFLTTRTGDFLRFAGLWPFGRTPCACLVLGAGFLVATGFRDGRCKRFRRFLTIPDTR